MQANYEIYFANHDAKIPASVLTDHTCARTLNLVRSYKIDTLKALDNAIRKRKSFNRCSAFPLVAMVRKSSFIKHPTYTFRQVNPKKILFANRAKFAQSRKCQRWIP